MAIVSARTRIHRCHKHEPAWILQRSQSSRDADGAVFQRLPEDLQNVLAELGQLIQEKHAVMRERDFARTRRAASAGKSRVADGVMRRSKRTRGQQPFLFEAASNRID